MNNNRATADLTTIRIDDETTLIRAQPDGVHVMRAVNHESAVVLLVVRGGEVEVWVRLP